MITSGFVLTVVKTENPHIFGYSHATVFSIVTDGGLL